MTEGEWLAAKDLWGMVCYISEHASYRKLKLFTCALHRQVAPRLPAPCHLEGLDEVVVDPPGRRGPIIYHSMPVARALLRMIFDTAQELPGASDRMKVFIPPLAHCVFGNPFRRVKLDRGCLPPASRALAKAAYDGPVMPACELDTARLAVAGGRA